MSSRRSKQRYHSERVPWQPTPLCLTHRVNVLHRDESGEPWWGDGHALFRGIPPHYLADRHRTALTGKLTAAAAITAARDTPEATALGEPIASYQTNGGGSTTVPVDVFAGAAAPEIHVDARYVTHARRTFPICTFWWGADAVLVRDRVGAVAGIIQRRRAPGEQRPRRRRGMP